MQRHSKMKYLKKTINEYNNEYLDSTKLIDEINDPDFKYYTIAKPICDVLNYYQENTPDAFGNAPYQRLDGFMQGYLAGANLTLERGDAVWTVKRGNKRIFIIEVPTKPKHYYEAVKDNAETKSAFFG